MQHGMSRVQVRFSGTFDETEQAGGIVLGYRSPEQHYVFAELDAAGSAYMVGEYVSGFGWRPLVATGQRGNLKRDRDYVLQVNLIGQELKVLTGSCRISRCTFRRKRSSRSTWSI